MRSQLKADSLLWSVAALLQKRGSLSILMVGLAHSPPVHGEPKQTNFLDGRCWPPQALEIGAAAHSCASHLMVIVCPSPLSRNAGGL